MVNQILIKYDEKRYLSHFLCAPQYKLKRFVTMATYWVPDLSMGFSGHLWHSILIFANRALEEGAVASTLEWAVQVRALAGDIVLCSWARHFTPTVPLSAQVCKRVWANCWGNLTNCREGTCDGLASHLGEVEVLPAASCYRNRDKFRKLWASLGSKASLFMDNPISQQICWLKFAASFNSFQADRH